MDFGFVLLLMQLSRYGQLHRRLGYANVQNVTELRKCKSVPFDLYSWDSKVEFWKFLFWLNCSDIFIVQIFSSNCSYSFIKLFRYFHCSYIFIVQTFELFRYFHCSDIFIVQIFSLFRYFHQIIQIFLLFRYFHQLFSDGLSLSFFHLALHPQSETERN